MSAYPQLYFASLCSCFCSPIIRILIALAVSAVRYDFPRFMIDKPLHRLAQAWTSWRHTAGTMTRLSLALSVFSDFVFEYVDPDFGMYWITTVVRFCFYFVRVSYLTAMSRPLCLVSNKSKNILQSVVVSFVFFIRVELSTSIHPTSESFYP